MGIFVKNQDDFPSENYNFALHSPEKGLLLFLSRGAVVARFGTLCFAVDAVEVAHRLKTAGVGDVDNRHGMIFVRQQLTGVIQTIIVDELLEVFVEKFMETTGEIVGFISQGIRHGGKCNVFGVMTGDER